MFNNMSWFQFEECVDDSAQPFYKECLAEVEERKEGSFTFIEKVPL